MNISVKWSVLFILWHVLHFIAHQQHHQSLPLHPALLRLLALDHSLFAWHAYRISHVPCSNHRCAQNVIACFLLPLAKCHLFQSRRLQWELCLSCSVCNQHVSWESGIWTILIWEVWEWMGKGTLLISVGLSAAPAKSLAPKLLGSSTGSVIWLGWGTDGTRFCFPASLGIVVPETAMSDSEPPLWGSSWEDILNPEAIFDWLTSASRLEIKAERFENSTSWLCQSVHELNDVWWNPRSNIIIICVVIADFDGMSSLRNKDHLSERAIKWVATVIRE